MCKIYESTQIFVNFILESKWTEQEFKDKIANSENMKFYLVDKNRNKFNPEVNKGLKEIRYLLKPMAFNNLLADFGHFNQAELLAGTNFTINLDV